MAWSSRERNNDLMQGVLCGTLLCAYSLCVWFGLQRLSLSRQPALSLPPSSSHLSHSYSHSVHRRPSINNRKHRAVVPTLYRLHTCIFFRENIGWHDFLSQIGWEPVPSVTEQGTLPGFFSPCPNCGSRGCDELCSMPASSF